MFDTRTEEPITIGVSLVGRCQPCLEHYLADARKAGATSGAPSAQCCCAVES